MKLSRKLIMVSAAALMGISPVMGSAQLNPVQAATAKSSKTKKTTTTKKTTAATNKKTTTTDKKASAKNSSVSSNSKKAASDSNSIKLIHNAYVYDQNGKRIMNYNGTSYIGKNVTVKQYGTKVIKGKKYYFLGKDSKKVNAYIKVANVAGNATANSSKSAKASADDNLKLTHNAYIYDKNGKRTKDSSFGNKIDKGTVMNYYGVKKISGKRYYQLDSKGTAFIKTGNAKRVAKATYITLKKNAYVYNSEGDTKKQKYKKGQSLKTTELRYIGTKAYYKIGNNKFVKAANVGKITGPELEAVNEPDGAASVDGAGDTTDSTQTIATMNSLTYIYNAKGQRIGAAQAFSQGIKLPVSELLYIATSANSTPQLFYKLATGKGYLRATDVTISGNSLQISNTPQDAIDAVKVAGTADKVNLKTAIDRSAQIKTQTDYKLSAPTLRNAYDSAVAKGNSIYNNSSATVAEVNDALANITNAEAKLTGQKIVVNDLNNLTQDEQNEVRKLVATYYGNGVTEDEVTFSSPTTLTINFGNGYPGPTLQLSDFAVQQQATLSNPVNNSSNNN